MMMGGSDTERVVLIPLGGKTHQKKGSTQTNDDDNCAADGGQPRQPSPGSCVGVWVTKWKFVLFFSGFFFFISFGKGRKERV